MDYQTELETIIYKAMLNSAILESTKCIIGEFNRLQNNRAIPQDQLLHRNYPPRKSSLVKSYG